MNILKKVVIVASVSLLATAMTPSGFAWADSIRDRQWYLRSLQAAQAHHLSTGAGVVVAVIDTGVSPNQDLRKNLLGGTDITEPENSNGRIDTAGHGTGMASLIAAHGRGSRGIQGLAPSAKILPIRVAKVSPVGAAPSADPIAQGIKWAVANKATVINVSMGTGPARELVDAVADAVDQNVVVVAAVGNTSITPIIEYPAAADGALAVGATGRDGKYASISFKDPKVQICAPGVDIESAGPNNTYRNASGTSDSTAIVSGAAALVRVKFPRLSAKEVVHRLTATADDIGPPGRDDECGFGRLNIVRALTAEVPPLEATTPSASATSSAAATTAPTSATSDTAALPETEPTGGGSAPVIFGVLFGVILAGGLTAFFLIRQRRMP